MTLSFSTNGKEMMRIYSDGSVGIGDTASVIDHASRFRQMEDLTHNTRLHALNRDAFQKIYIGGKTFHARCGIPEDPESKRSRTWVSMWEDVFLAATQVLDG